MFCTSCYSSMNRTLEEVRATRRNGVIYVTMVGMLPTPCHQANVVDKFPGGTIRYIRDPGTAEVFISMGLRPENIGKFCLQVIVPFILEEEIPDNWHDEVTIYINKVPFKTIKIEEELDISH